MVAGGDYTCGEHQVMHKTVKSTCCTPETNVTLYVNYTSIKKANGASVKQNKINKQNNNI